MRILGISGCLRRDSHNTKLLRAAADLLPPGAELVVLDPDGAARDSRPTTRTCASRAEPPPSTALREAVAGADAVLFATPGVQPLAPGLAEERARLALAPDRRQPAAGQGRRRRRRQHRHVRRRLGAGRAAQGARRGSARASSTASCRSCSPTSSFDEAGGLIDADVRARSSHSSADARRARDAGDRCCCLASWHGATAIRPRLGEVCPARGPYLALARSLLRVRADRRSACRAPCERMRFCSALWAAG